MTRRRSWIAGAAILVTALTAVSTLLGLARDVTIAAVFGAGGALDAYFVALGLMNVVLGLIASAMTKSAVPVLARQGDADADDRANDGDDHGPGERARRSSATVSVVLTATVVGLGVATLVLQVLTTDVIGLVAPGFGPERSDDAVLFTRIVLIATVLVAGTNLLAAAAQARRVFVWSAVQGVPFNLTMIVAAAVFGPRFGVVALAWGFVAGSALRLVLQLVPLRRLGMRLRISVDHTDPGFRAIVVMIPPLLVGSAVGNVNTLVDRAVGSLQGDGVISSLSYAWRLVGLADTVLIASLLVALYPALSTAVDDRGELRRLVGRGLGATLVVLVPVCVVLVVAARPVVDLVFGHGNFTADDASATARALQWYAPAILALGWREVAVRASYALGDTRRPVVVAVVAMVVNVVGDLTVGRLYGIPGLAASTSASLFVAAVGTTWLLARAHRGIDLGAGGRLLGRAMLAGAAATGAAVGVLQWTPGTGDVLGALVTVGAVGIGALVASTAVLVALRAPELAVLRDAGRLLVPRRGRRGP